MTSTAARKAFSELGYGDKELHEGLPKLEYLAQYDPELLGAIVEQCRSSDPIVAQMWRQWFTTYPARIIEQEPREEHLHAFRTNYHLLPVAVAVSKEGAGNPLLTIDALLGSASQFMDRTGTHWDTGKAFMIVVTLMPFGYRTSSSAEGIDRIRYVAKHIDQVVELIPEIAARTGAVGVKELEAMIAKKFPDDDEGEDDTVGSATLDA